MLHIVAAIVAVDHNLELVISCNKRVLSYNEKGRKTLHIPCNALYFTKEEIYKINVHQLHKIKNKKK